MFNFFSEPFEVIDLGVHLDAAFPIKIRGGSAGWVRPVAIVPRRQFEEAN